MHVKTTTPNLNTVRVEVANLTDRQAHFMRSIIALMTLGGPALEAVEGGDGLIGMAKSGDCTVTITSGYHEFRNN
jgi:hypothetical protein